MLIGLSSLKPQVGKTEVVRHLKKSHDFMSAEMSDAICILAEKFFGYNGDKSDPAQRKILQDLGFMGKQIHPTIWFYHALGLARRRKWGLPTDDLISPSFLFYYHLQPIIEEIEARGVDEFMEGGNVVMAGVRSPDEADEILKVGGKVLLITRESELEYSSYTNDGHKVESQLKDYSKFNGIIDNNGTLDELYAKVDSIIKGE